MACTVWVMCSHSPYPSTFRSLQSPPPRPDTEPRDYQQRGFSRGMPYASRAVPMVRIVYFPLLYLLLSSKEMKAVYIIFALIKASKLLLHFWKLCFSLIKSRENICFLRVGAPQFPSLSFVLGGACLDKQFTCFFLMTEHPPHMRRGVSASSPAPLLVRALVLWKPQPARARSQSKPSAVVISLSVFFKIQHFPDCCCFFLLSFSEERAALTLPGWFSSGLECHLFSDANILIPSVQFVNVLFIFSF